MKKLLTVIFSLFLCSSAFAIGNQPSNTLPIDSSNQITGSYLPDTRTFLRDEDADRMARWARDFVFSGGIHGTSVSMTSPAFALEAFTSSGNRICISDSSDACAQTITIDYNAAGCAANDTAWVIGSASSSDNLSNFSRVGGAASGNNVYVDCTSSTKPVLPADSVYLMEVTIASSAITVVSDIGNDEPIVVDDPTDVAPHITSGCMPATSGTTTFAAFACVGFVKVSDVMTPVDQEAVTVGPLSDGDGVYWIAIHQDTTTAVSGWTRETGTHYLWQQNATKPAEPTEGLIFTKATVSGGAITIVELHADRLFTTNLTIAANQTVGAGEWRFRDLGHLTHNAGVVTTFGGTLKAQPEQDLISCNGSEACFLWTTNYMPEQIYFEWWGAIRGDGVDDSSAMISTFASIPVSGGTVQGLEGVYRVENSITFPDDGAGIIHPIWLRGISQGEPAGDASGDERGQTKFDCQQASGGCLDLRGTGANDRFFGGISHITFRGQDTAGTYGIQAYDVVRARFDQIATVNFDVGIEVLDDFYYAVWSRVRSASNLGDGIRLLGLGNYGVMRDCIVGSNGGDGLYLEDIGDGFTITSSYFEANGEYGIWANGFTRLGIRDSYFEFNSGTLGANEAEIRMSDGGATGPSGLELIGNHFLNNTTFTQAVLVDADAGDHLVLLHNHFNIDDYTYAIGFVDTGEVVHLTAIGNRTYGGGTTDVQLVENVDQLASGAAWNDHLAFEQFDSWNWTFRGVDSTQDAALEVQTATTAIQTPVFLVNSRGDSFDSDIVRIVNRQTGGGIDGYSIAAYDNDGANRTFSVEIVSPVMFLEPQATAPATCSIGDFYVDTSGASCACSATNTWSNMHAIGTCS